MKAMIGDRSNTMADYYSREYEKKGHATATVRKLERNERRRLEKTADAVGKNKKGVR